MPGKSRSGRAAMTPCCTGSERVLYSHGAGVWVDCDLERQQEEHCIHRRRGTPCQGHQPKQDLPAGYQQRIPD